MRQRCSGREASLSCSTRVWVNVNILSTVAARRADAARLHAPSHCSTTQTCRYGRCALGPAGTSGCQYACCFAATARTTKISDPELYQRSKGRHRTNPVDSQYPVPVYWRAPVPPVLRGRNTQYSHIRQYSERKIPVPSSTGRRKYHGARTRTGQYQLSRHTVTTFATLS